MMQSGKLLHTLIHIGLHVHNGGLQQICGLALNNTPDIVIEGIQIKKAKRPHLGLE